jgi:hypothetical protein
MSDFWAPREVVGPNCTEAQAIELWDMLFNGNGWPNRKDIERPSIMASYVKKFESHPHSCSLRAVIRIVEEEKFFPPWATIRETIEAEWRTAGKTWKPQAGE